MALVDQSQATIKLGDFSVAPATALSDPFLLQRVQAWRRQLGGRMIALDKAHMVKRIPEGAYHVSRKVDGEFTILVFEGDEAISVNPGGTVRIGLPFMKEAAELLKAAGIKQALIAGELYVNRSDGKRPRIHDVVKVARKPASAAELDTLQFAVFDVLEIDGNDPDPVYAKTWEWIGATFGGGGRIHPVETTITGKAKEIPEHFESWVEGAGGEGLVVRNDESGMFKVKPRHSIDVAVIGFAEGTEDRAGMLHDLLLAIMRKDGSFHIAGRVGGGFSDEQRVQFLSDLQDREVESEYAEVNSDRVAYRMVKPEWIAEISCLDLVSETTRGGSIDRMVLNWNDQASRWETIRRMPLVSIISPQFVRLRDDKTANVDDIRIDQFTDLVEVPLADKSTEDLVLPPSQVTKRIVATKVMKEKELVRKLVCWKTNKENETSDEFPAWVIYFTDFSPNRKDPLKREIRVSDSEDQIIQMWQELEDKNFNVRGWNPVK